MKKLISIILGISILFIFSCKKEETTEPIPDNPTPMEEIVGMYDCQKYIWYIANSGGASEENLQEGVVEITKKGNTNDYNFYLNGHWQATLKFDRVYDDVLYCTVRENEGYWSSDNVTYEMSGWNTPLADYPSSEVTFQMNKNNKLEVCFRFYNLKDGSTQEPRNFWVVIYYEGYRR